MKLGSGGHHGSEGQNTLHIYVVFLFLAAKYVIVDRLRWFRDRHPEGCHVQRHEKRRVSAQGPANLRQIVMEGHSDTRTRRRGAFHSRIATKSLYNR